MGHPTRSSKAAATARRALSRSAAEGTMTRMAKPHGWASISKPAPSIDGTGAALPANAPQDQFNPYLNSSCAGAWHRCATDHLHTPARAVSRCHGRTTRRTDRRPPRKRTAAHTVRRGNHEGRRPRGNAIPRALPRKLPRTGGTTRLFATREVSRQGDEQCSDFSTV